MTKNQANILASIKQGLVRGRRWLPTSVLDCYDGRSVRALVRSGRIEINGEYGVRVL